MLKCLQFTVKRAPNLQWFPGRLALAEWEMAPEGLMYKVFMFCWQFQPTKDSPNLFRLARLQCMWAGKQFCHGAPCPLGPERWFWDGDCVCRGG